MNGERHLLYSGTLHTIWQDGILAAVGLYEEDAIAAARQKGVRGIVYVEEIHVSQSRPAFRVTSCRISDDDQETSKKP